MRIPLAALLALLAACDDAADPGADAAVSSSITLTLEPPPAEAETRATMALALRATTPDGRPLAGVVLTPEVLRGGGTADPVTTEADGRATLLWDLGHAPVPQRIAVTAGPARVEATIDATTLSRAGGTQPLGDVAAWLAERQLGGSTEDLEFVGDRLVLGVPSGLIQVDPAGTIEPMALTGQPIDQPLGIAAAADGTLWVADSGAAALLRVDPAGEVSVALTEVEGAPLEGPNFVAVGPDNKIYLSDPCLGLLIRFDPAAGVVDATHPFDRATEGGPNGFSFQGDTLWVVTENTVLVCGQGGLAPVDAPLAGLFRLPVTADGFGERTTVATGLGVFGDGLTLDAEGNVYVVLDQVANLRLAESAVWVLPEGHTTLRKFIVAPEGLLFANVEFGSLAFAEESLYVSLLSVPPFAGPASRGVRSYHVGIPGPP